MGQGLPGDIARLEAAIVQLRPYSSANVRNLLEWFEEQHWKHAASSKLEEAQVAESGTDEEDGTGGSGDGKEE